MDTKLQVKVSNEQAMPDVNGYTLIMPSVSVGNVGQFAVDLLISTLKLKRVAFFLHPAILPIIGYDPYDSDSEEVVTAADLYISIEKSLIVLQIRSPIIKEEKDEFLRDFNTWILESCFSDVIILSSTYAYLRQDQQLAGSQVRYLTNDVIHQKIDILKKIGPPELEKAENEYGIRKKMLCCSGLTKHLLDTCKLPCVALLKFAYEGDNTEDALVLVSYLNCWLNLVDNSTKWVKPISWEHLFGPPPPQEIY